MMIHECKVGMIVEFGRDNGEWTKGQVVKINPTKAKVKTLETRGTGRGSFAGAVWSVPYSMMRAVGDDGVRAEDYPSAYGQPGVAKSVGIADLPYQYNPFHEDNLIMEAIVDIYNRLSPENLTCDGEKPSHQVMADKRRLERKLGFLFQSIGRPVSESVAYTWSMAASKNP